MEEKERWEGLISDSEIGWDYIAGCNKEKHSCKIAS